MSGRIEQAGVGQDTHGLGPGDAELHALARSRPDLAWNSAFDIAIARNAHENNTRMQLAAGLAGEFDWLEADVRLGANGQPHMQHRLKDPIGLQLHQWLQIVVPSGRGIKLDVKEPEALPAVIAAVQRAGVRQDRLIMNVGPWPAKLLQSIRRAFPQAIINLSPISDTDLTPAEIVQLQVAARIVKGRVMFPIRHDLINPGVVWALRPFGRVAVWNTPELTNPTAFTTLELRLMGVDGMIDLREPSRPRDRLSTALVRVGARVFGWNAVYDVLDAVGLL